MGDTAWIGAVPDAKHAQQLAVTPGHDPAKLHVTLGFFKRAAADMGQERREQVAYKLEEISRYVSWPVKAEIVGRIVLRPPKGQWEAYALKSAALDVLAGQVHLRYGTELDHTFGWLPHITYRRLMRTDQPQDGPMPLNHVVFHDLQLAWGGQRSTCTPTSGKAKWKT